MFSAETYARRRHALAAMLSRSTADHGLVLLPGNRDSPRNYRDNAFPFRQDSSFLYFLGLPWQNLDAVIDCATGETTLFGEDPTIDDLVWSGPQPSLGELGARTGARRVLSPKLLPSTLARATGAGRRIHYLPPWRDATVLRMALLLDRSPAEISTDASPQLIRSAVSLREIKEDAEIAELEAAVAVSVAMHRQLLHETKAGMREWELAAIATRIALASGGQLSYRIIATRRGEVLHNRLHEALLQEGDLVLVDAGAESAEGYAGDLTTTYPASATFSPRQRDLYSLLCSVFEAATSRLVPGIPMREVHVAAAQRLAEGLVSLGLMRGDPAEAVAAGAHALFFPHGLGHMIGLDVHDMEDYGEDYVGYDAESGPRSMQFGLHSLRLARRLVPGMVHSVEPGIYFIPGLIEKWKAARLNEAFIDYDELERWTGTGGLRYEEDWLMTQTGARRLGPAFDRSLAAIESARGGS